MESNPDDPGHIQASACCKHYVANSMDGTTQSGIEHDRNHYDANITQQDLLDSYMLPFQSCVEKGKVSGLMCSYNRCVVVLVTCLQVGSNVERYL